MTSERSLVAVRGDAHRVSQLATLVNGYPFDSSDFASDAEVPLVRIRDLASADFETFVPRDKVPSFAFVRDGDVVIGMDGDFNSVLWNRGEAALNQRVCLLRAKPGVDARYLAYAIPEHLQRINDLTWSTTVKHLSAGSVRAIRVPAYTRIKQRAIADFLDRETAQIDAFIAKNGQLITLLTERRAAAIELAINPPSPPAGWESCQVRRLGPKSESGVSVNGYSVAAMDGEIGVLRTGAVSKGFFDPHDNKRVVEEDLERVATPVRGGTLLVNRANTPELVGQGVYVANSHPHLFLSDKLWQITFATADPAFMYYWTLTSSYRAQLGGLSVGASSSMQNLSYRDFLAVTISLPPLPAQHAIVERLDDTTARINRAIATATRAIDLARERRAALISAAVTGKISVGVDV